MRSLSHHAPPCCHDESRSQNHDVADGSETSERVPIICFFKHDTHALHHGKACWQSPLPYYLATSARGYKSTAQFGLYCLAIRPIPRP